MSASNLSHEIRGHSKTDFGDEVIVAWWRRNSWSSFVSVILVIYLAPSLSWTNDNIFFNMTIENKFDEIGNKLSEFPLKK